MSRSKSIRRLDRATAVDYALGAFIILLSLAFLYPVWFCLIISFTGGEVVKHYFPLLLPENLTLDAYRMVLSSDSILMYFGNSIFYSAVGTMISLLCTSMMAYPFIVKDFRGKKFFNIYMLVTMFFSGGLLPYYFLISALKWHNTVWPMLIPGDVGAYTVIVYRTFFNNVPESLREAAYIDGAGHYRTLFSILVPVSKPLLATFALFGIVGKWNDWFTPNLFFTKNHLLPIQTYLREALITAATMEKRTGEAMLMLGNTMAINIQCAVIIVTIAPVLTVYPFLQKYFASGIMIGSVKA